MIMRGIGLGNYPVDFGRLFMGNTDVMDYIASLPDETRAYAATRFKFNFGGVLKCTCLIIRSILLSFR